MTKTFVIVLEGRSIADGGITDFDHVQDAARFIDGLLEKGIEHQSIRVLAGHDVEIQVNQKPVVTLVPTSTQLEETKALAETTAMSRTEHDLVPVDTGESSEPYTRDGIRFSSAFAAESLGQRTHRTRGRYGPFIQQPA